MRPGQRPLDPHLAALIDRERSALDRPMDPHMAALEPDGDEYAGEMDVDSSDYADDPLVVMDPAKAPHTPEQVDAERMRTLRSAEGAAISENEYARLLEAVRASAGR